MDDLLALVATALATLAGVAAAIMLAASPRYSIASLRCAATDVRE